MLASLEGLHGLEGALGVLEKLNEHRRRGNNPMLKAYWTQCSWQDDGDLLPLCAGSPRVPAAHGEVEAERVMSYILFLVVVVRGLGAQRPGVGEHIVQEAIQCMDDSLGRYILFIHAFLLPIMLGACCCTRFLCCLSGQPGVGDRCLDTIGHPCTVVREHSPVLIVEVLDALGSIWLCRIGGAEVWVMSVQW